MTFAPVWRRPAPQLRPWVSTYVGYRTEASPPSVHQGVASGHLTLILCVDGAVEILENADPTNPPGRYAAMVAGLSDGPARVASGEAQTGVQLDLTWEGARALLGTPAAELAGDSVDLNAVLGRRCAHLLEQLAEAPGWGARFAVLDRELTALADAGRALSGIRPEVRRAAGLIRASGGTARVADLADDVGWSRRHLTDLFRRETGLGPKAMARVVRFERVCRRLRRPDRPALATAAAEAGYVDQAHLARDFRDLAGLTATEWIAERTS
ncbi:helix-turn-helix domain-containing protein [Pseudonocardia sp. CA-107938]|uniref:helix-turn-helix domain-containing protein n=1 Tax=Pseudonocardia sp. CA-107938 TaxID=3240021 RepID=UPI003D8FBEA8